MDVWFVNMFVNIFLSGTTSQLEQSLLLNLELLWALSQLKFKGFLN